MSGLPGFSIHPAVWVVVLGSIAGYALMVRRSPVPVTRRQAWLFLAAMVVLVVALTWPVANLAAHRLLLALVLQRLLLMLAVPPLLLAGVPRPVLAAATRPAPVDWLARRATRPVPAVLIVTVVAVATLIVPAVDAQAKWATVRGVFDLLLLAAGTVLWLPVLDALPAAPRIPPLGRAGYLVVQSIVPSFLSIVWIFARHPLYPAYASTGKTFGINPLLDQQISGFVAKLGTIAVLWAVVFVIVTRSERAGDAADEDNGPLTWADVERQLERISRRERRRARRAQRAGPRSQRRSGHPGSRRRR